jgi:hypothetical protein
MQVVAHENRTAAGQCQLLAWCSGNGVTLNHDCAADYTIAKLGNRCIDPHFPRARKHLAFTRPWLEKFRSFDPHARISRIRESSDCSRLSSQSSQSRYVNRMVGPSRRF